MAEFAASTVAAMKTAGVNRLAIVSAAILFPEKGLRFMFFRWLLRHHARDRLPEPVDLDHGGLARIERLEHISMAFLVVLQRLTPAERAVLLLHDVFVAATTASSAGTLRVERHELNGQPAIVFWTGEQPFAALLLAVADGKVQRVFSTPTRTSPVSRPSRGVNSEVRADP